MFFHILSFFYTIKIMNKFVPLIKRSTSLLLLFFIFGNASARDFVHPGVSNTRSDLDRMKYAVKTKMEPWYSSYLALMADTKSNHNYSIRGNPEWTYLNRENPAVNKHEFENDVQAAYANALMWYITEDERHAQKTVEILNTWSNLQAVDGIPLGPGLYGGPLIDAAEIIRHTYDGWEEKDLEKFENMLVYPGYSSKIVPSGAYNTSGASQSTFYWRTYYGDPARAGNQDASCWRTVMAIGVFLDNDTIYDRGYNYLTSQPTRSDDVPNAPGPSPQGAKKTESSDQHKTEYEYVGPLNQIQDYGYNGAIQNYIYENGQIQESSRDQVHSFLGTGLLANAAEIAWSQGDDMYGFLDNRILLGLEFTLKYCLSYYQTYPNQTEAWEPTVENGLYMEKDDRTGRSTAHKINPYVSNNYERWSRNGPLDMKIVEAPLAHYKQRQGLDSEKYKWLERTRNYALEKNGIENRSGLDFNGWGALTDRRIVLCPGDPVRGFTEKGTPDYSLPELPGLISAENFDYFPINGGGGTGKSYFKNTSTLGGNVYRPEEDVHVNFSDSDKGYYLVDLKSGDWYNYTIALPEADHYDIYLHYCVENEKSSIALDFNGTPVVSDVILPQTTVDNAEAETWNTFKIASGVSLEGLVQAMRLRIASGDNTLKIGDIIVLRKGSSSGAIDYLLNQRRNSHSGDTNLPLLKSNRSWNIYPNPTSGIFEIEVDSDQALLIRTIDVYDLTGKCMRSDLQMDKSGVFDVANIPPGIYIVKIDMGDYSMQRKMIKTK